MSGSIERAVEKGIKYGSVFAEVCAPIWKTARVDIFQLNPVTKAIFGVASVTFEVRAGRWRMRSKGNA